MSARRSASGPGASSAFQLPSDYVPPTQPPSARSPDARKSQLLRTYTSTLRSTPLLLVFQHSNLTAVEWSAIRRELGLALAKVPPPPPLPADAAPGLPPPVDIASSVRLQVIRTGMFKVALRVVEFFDSGAAAATTGLPDVYTHDLSEAAYEATSKMALQRINIPEMSTFKQLGPLLVGPLAILKFPAISPAHLSAALSILAPSPPEFPPPTRRVNPGYYEAVFQNAVKKLLLVGGRIESKVFDVDGVKWVGGIDGGLDVLRAQLVALLQSAGIGLTNTLEGAGKSLWLTVESRRSVLEEEEKAAKGNQEKGVEAGEASSES